MIVITSQKFFQATLKRAPHLQPSKLLILFRENDDSKDGHLTLSLSVLLMLEL